MINFPFIFTILKSENELKNQILFGNTPNVHWSDAVMYFWTIWFKIAAIDTVIRLKMQIQHLVQWKTQKKKRIVNRFVSLCETEVGKKFQIICATHFGNSIYGMGWIHTIIFFHLFVYLFAIACKWNTLNLTDKKKTHRFLESQDWTTLNNVKSLERNWKHTAHLSLLLWNIYTTISRYFAYQCSFIFIFHCTLFSCRRLNAFYETAT